jgi:hypothetical protein
LISACDDYAYVMNPIKEAADQRLKVRVESEVSSTLQLYVSSLGKLSNDSRLLHSCLRAAYRSETWTYKEVYICLHTIDGAVGV